MPPFLGCQCLYSFDDKTPFPGAKATLTHYVLADLFFLKPWRNVSLTCLVFFVLTRHKTVLKTIFLQSWVLSQTITEHNQCNTTNKKQADTQTSTFSALYIEEGSRHSTDLVADLSSAIWFTVWPSESLLCLQIPAPTNKLEILKPPLQNWFKIYEDVSTIWCLTGSH